MAIARCVIHRPEGRKHIYDFYTFPIGYPDNTAVVCGREDCSEPALIWLNVDETKSHKRGWRIFEISTNSAKVRVANDLESA